MKKLFTQVVLKNGELKDVYVCVDDETAKVLEQVDEVTRKAYLQDEWEMKMAENYHRRKVQSLEKSLENGFEVVDESQDVEAKAIKEIELSIIKKSFAVLTPKQIWLVKELYIKKRTQEEIAEELHITQPAISYQIATIKGRIKKFLKKF